MIHIRITSCSKASICFNFIIEYSVPSNISVIKSCWLSPHGVLTMAVCGDNLYSR